MPHIASNRESDERLLAALRLRDLGRPYDEIARRLGYKSPHAIRGLISKVRAADREAEHG